jgi:hypothetical protein
MKYKNWDITKSHWASPKEQVYIQDLKCQTVHIIKCCQSSDRRPLSKCIK